ncbi:MAG TPA: ABC transporter permease [Candidatus Alectryocaccomicrobium excrementavium]|uniref:ABC transporter permease n=1 Tax=Candidatus Alectryocaccomicrobium excrementavium TaxID=2840668 RepID=A0A9D1G318_9FIRM|nr:ABC transporter permease [Candidatus Alectryocaccomicrobium excrementavium]
MSEGLSYFLSFLAAAIPAGMPLLYGTLGEILTEKGGNLNLGVEGMMYMGAIFGFVGGYYADSVLVMLLLAFAGGALGALIYAVLTVTLKANQNVTGLTLTIFGTGLANFIGENIVLSSPSQTAKVSDALMARITNAGIPLLKEIPILGPMLFDTNIFVYLGIAIAVGMGLYLNHTRKGLNLRAIGENPAAADAAGVNVTLYKYAHILVGGGVCGIGGAYVTFVTCSGMWIQDCVGGLGWIAVALVIFASWSPYRALLGSLVFGALRVVQFYKPAFMRGISDPLFSMIPFLVTAIVLVITSIRLRPERMQPKGCGTNYDREER